MILYLPFKVPGRRIYEIQPKGYQHWNHKEVLTKNSGGDFPKTMTFFMHNLCSIRSLRSKEDLKKIMNAGYQNIVTLTPDSPLLGYHYQFQNYQVHL